MGKYYGPYYVPDPNDAPGTPLSQNPNQGSHGSTRPAPYGGTGNSTPSYNGAGSLNPALTGGYGNNTSTGAPRKWTSDSYGTQANDIVNPPGGGGGAGGSMPFVPYSAPGYAEDYYNKHKGFFDQPGAASQYWNGVQGFFANPTQGETDLYDYGHQMGSTPGASETRYDNNVKSGVYDRPGAAEDFWSQHGSDFATPGRGEDALGGVLDSLKAPGAAEDYYSQHGSDFASPGQLEQLYPELYRQLSGPGYTERMANGYTPEASYSEQFLTGGGATGGLDQVYDRLYQQGSKRIGDEGAARGSYNSGASLRATQELSGDLTSRHVADLQSASTAADSAKMARLGYGLNLMKGADESGINRLGLLGTSAGNAQEAMRNRVLAGGTLASAAETGMLGRMSGTTNASKALGDLSRERLTAGSEASTRAQDATNTRLRTGMDASHQATADYMDRLAKAGGLSKDAAKLALDRLATGGQLSASAGLEDTNRIIGGQTSSKIAQDAKEGRESGVLKNLMSVATAQADKYDKMTSQQRSEEMQLKMSEIDGMLQRGQIDASEAAQMRDLYSQLLKLPLAAAGTPGGSGGSAPAKPPAAPRGGYSNPGPVSGPQRYDV